MSKTSIILLLSIFLAGCGTANEGTRNSQEKVMDNDVIDKEIVSYMTEANQHVFEYVVKNKGIENVLHEFTSSQRFDYSVANTNGKEIYLYSSTASFLTVLGQEELKPDGELKYEINLTNLNLSKGNYTLTAWMTTKNGNMYTTTKEITIE